MTEFSRIKLFHFPMTRSARVKWMLHELFGEAFEVEVVPLYDGAQHSPEFLAMNANHAVPVLHVTEKSGNAFTMIESGAIVAWLADLDSGEPLAPRPGATPERADYLQILHFAASWFDMHLWQIRVHRDLTPPDRRPQAIIDRCMKKIRDEIEPQLEKRLAKGGFATGNGFSAADCILGHNVRWARFYGLCEQQAFEDYLGRLAERPAYRAAFADVDHFSLSPPARSG
jgi:glutathione S-transferase